MLKCIAVEVSCEITFQRVKPLKEKWIKFCFSAWFFSKWRAKVYILVNKVIVSEWKSDLLDILTQQGVYSLTHLELIVPKFNLKNVLSRMIGSSKYKRFF